MREDPENIHITEYLNKRNELQLELAEVNETIKAFQENLTEDKQLAVHLHSLMCKMEHNETCGWYYSHPEGLWNRWERRQYLHMANTLLKSGSSKEAIIECADVLYGEGNIRKNMLYAINHGGIELVTRINDAWLLANNLVRP